MRRERSDLEQAAPLAVRTPRPTAPYLCVCECIQSFLCILRDPVFLWNCFVVTVVIHGLETFRHVDNSILIVFL